MALSQLTKGVVLASFSTQHIQIVFDNGGDRSNYVGLHLIELLVCVNRYRFEIHKGLANEMSSD